jgi:DNA-binding NtrC family response regulator
MEPPGTDEGTEEEMLDLRSRMERGRSVSVAHALREAGGNKTKAANLLGISRAHLYRILSDTGLRKRSDAPN